MILLTDKQYQRELDAVIYKTYISAAEIAFALSNNGAVKNISGEMALDLYARKILEVIKNDNT